MLLLNVKYLLFFPCKKTAPVIAAGPAVTLNTEHAGGCRKAPRIRASFAHRTAVL